MNIFHKLTARWYLRVLLPLISGGLLFYGIINILPVRIIPLEFMMLFSALFASGLFEFFRYPGIWHLFGLTISKFTHREIFTGLSLSIIIVSLIGSILIISGAGIIWTPADSDMILFNSMIIFALAAFEEIAFRGIIFRALIERFNPYLIITSVSLVFTFFHYSNPDSSALSSINTFLFSILMCLSVAETKSLWFAIAYHFGFNWSEVFILSSPVSGYNWDSGLWGLTNIDKVPEILSGSGYGIEGGILTTLFLILSFPALKFLPSSPYVTSLLFKRKYYESKLLN